MAASIGTQLKGRLTSEIRVSVEACVTKFRLGLGFQFSTQGGALKKGIYYIAAMLRACGP